MHRALGSWVMIRVVCLLISAVGWRRTTSVSPRPRRRIRQRVAVGEFDNNNNNVNAAHFRPSNPIPLIRLACHSEFLSICNKNASRIGRPYEGGRRTVRNARPYLWP